MKPIIGMTIMCADVNGSKVYSIHEGYTKAILAAGGLPLYLPAVGSPEEYAELAAQHIDGYLVPGGADVAPLLYGEEPQRTVTYVNSFNDLYEKALILKMAELGKPVIGMCRGIQMINVAFGGTLWQDLPSQVPDSIGHLHRGPLYEGYHTVNLAEGSRLSEIFGENKLYTNTTHHQAVKDPAPGFKVAATAPDGIIEAIEHESKYVFGVQWHPECMFEVHPVFAKYFEAFVEEAKRVKNK